jgi:hypothetical protein
MKVSIASSILSWYHPKPSIPLLRCSFFSIAHSPASSSSSSTGNSGNTVHDLDPFHTAAAPALPVVASSIPLPNIRHHVLETLDLHDANYASWSSLFELTFRKHRSTEPSG